MKNSLILFLVTLLQLGVIAQSDDINHRKYWYYRSRLTNDFVKVGSLPGESLPISIRDIYASSYGSLNAKTLTGTDAVSQLGPYICVLATEYKLLSSNGQATDSTLRELYYALEAFNRLDYTAESLWGNANALDGFFIRQDVPTNFVTNRLSHFNYELNLMDPITASTTQSLNAKGFCSLSHVESIWKNTANVYEDPYSEWQNTPTPDNRNKLAMSLDQCINMFNACALINKFFAGGITYDVNSTAQAFLDGEVSIKQEARNISGRILGALQGGGDWRILMPGGIHVPDAIGGNAFAYSFALSEADCKLHGSNNSLLPCIGSGNFLAASAGFATWNGYGSAAGVSLDLAHKDNAPKTIGLEAACNCDHALSWQGILVGFIESVIDYIIGWIHYFVYGDPIPQYNWQWVADNITATRIELRSGNGFNLQWAPLLRKVLHGGVNNSYSGFDYENFMNLAPCEGPRYFIGASNNPDTRWTSRDNIDHPFQPQYDPYPGEYSGIDYMLYHNLYCIDNPSYYSFPNDNRYKNLNLIIPYTVGGITYGTNSNAITIPALENIAAYNNIIDAVNPTVINDPANGNASYRAGKVVSLKPGFVAKNGSTFRAYIQRFNCGGDNDVHRLMAPQDSTKQTTGYTDTNFDVLPNTVPKVPTKATEEEAKEPLTKISDIKKNIIPTKKTTQSNSVSIFPNPSTGIFTVKLDVKSVANVIITVSDILNKEVFKQNVNTNNTKQLEVDLRGYNKGVYLISLNFGDGNTMVQKLIIQ